MDIGEHELKPGQYLTLDENLDAEITIQRSRFIASLRKVKNRDEVDAALKDIIELYPKASHHCWAYRFAQTPPIEHSSDAGEPTGTAGRPILGALKKYSLGNIFAVVTRYYGGVKLGVKGLIAAYRDTTLLAIESGRIVLEEPASLLTFTCSYELYNILLAKLERASLDLGALKTDFTDRVSGQIPVPNSTLPLLTEQLETLCSGHTNFSYEILSETS